MQDVSESPLANTVTYVGHSTVLVALDGVRVLTDPLLRSRVAHLRRRVPVDRIVRERVDTVLVSHAHYDHLDLPSLARLGRTTPVVVPRGIGSLLRRRRFQHVTELDAGETISVGALSVTATHAEHDGARSPLGARGAALGFVITGSRRVYFAGDTELFDGMSALTGGLDVALLPIWGWGPTLGGGGHMDPEEAAAAAAVLRPRVAIPIHWGTYHPLHRGVRGAPDFMRHPPVAFASAVARLAPDVETRVLVPGETLTLA